MCWVLEGVCLQLVHNYRMAQPTAILDYNYEECEVEHIRSQSVRKETGFSLERARKKAKVARVSRLPYGPT